MKEAFVKGFCLLATICFFPGIAAACPDVSFAVFSDPHYYDQGLGVEGPAFEEYLLHDRKLLRESEALLEAAIEGIQNFPEVQFVIVPGDLTKDGERTSHEEFAGYIQKLEDGGKPVFVIPGNHDINNPHAFAYEGEMVTPVPNLTPREFAEIYADFGYSEAVYRDPNSLSYIAEPVPGLWLFALDSCIYQENLELGYPVTGGRFSKETLNWIFERLSEAKAKGKKRIGFMHHGLLEHYVGQSFFFGEYIVEGYRTLSEILAKAGLQMVFTGHYHAQDVVQKSWDQDGVTTTLADAETGSLVTFPNPWRLVTLCNDTVMVKSQFITEIDYDTGDVPFPEYAETYIDEGLVVLALDILTLPLEEGGFGLDPADPLTEDIAGQVAQAIKAHYGGDEHIAPENQAAIEGYLDDEEPMIRLLGFALLLLWNDLQPEDTAPVITFGPDAAGQNRIICSTLGDNDSPSAVDWDVFGFHGEAGETVTLRLSAFPFTAGSWKRATLTVRNSFGGEFLLQLDRSVLPNEVTVALPHTGEYRVFVAEQPDIALGEGYVGNYFVELQASGKTCQSFGPAAWVEE